LCSEQSPCSVPDNETARLLILKQTRILDSDRNDIEYDRFVSLAQRILHVPYAFLTFIDNDRQWIKSDIGISIENPNVDRRDSLDSLIMFPDAPEVLLVTDILSDSRFQQFRAPFGSEANFSIRFYAGAVIVVDGFRLGVISVVDTSPRPVLSLCDRQNLLDLAAAISSLTKERRQRQLRLRKERANLMLGLNHNLRTPLMSLTLATEMLHNELKQIAISRESFDAGHHTPPGYSGALGSLLTMEPSPNGKDNLHHAISSKSLSRAGSETSLTDFFAHPPSNSLCGSIDAVCSVRHSQSSSFQRTPDVPYMNLMGDLQGSLQQLGLLVEMGLVLGKISSETSALLDGINDGILCDISKVFDKVQTLTQRMGHHQNVLWNIDRKKLSSGKQYGHPDVLMFVLISALTQLLPHSDLIRVKSTFLPIDDVYRYTDDPHITGAIAAVSDIICPTVKVGRVEILMTEMEIFGDTSNLKEIVSKLQVNCDDSETQSDNEELLEPLSFLNPEKEDFGDSIFAMGQLLDNVLGGSSYVMKNHGCIFAFSIPTRIEHNPNEDSDQFKSIYEHEQYHSFMISSKHRLVSIPSVIEETFFDNDISSIAKTSSDSDLKGEEMIDEKQLHCQTVLLESNKEARGTHRISQQDKSPRDIKSDDTASVHAMQNNRSELAQSESVTSEGFLGNDSIISEDISKNVNEDAALSPSSYDSEMKNKEHSSQQLQSSSVLYSVDKETVTVGSDTPDHFLSGQAENVLSSCNASNDDEREMNANGVSGRDIKLRVLIVDDSLTVQKVMSIWLSKKNCVITQALNGQIALDLMKRSAFDIVFMDFLMPVMDGLSCLKLFNRYMQSVPINERPAGIELQWIVGLSATAVPSDHQQAFEANMHMFCSKPVDTIALSYILDAKRNGMTIDTLRDLAHSNRKVSMTHDQIDSASSIMIPDSMDPKLKSDRECLTHKLEVSLGSNIFGPFVFNL
jgi:CheY-like chemotaxis protein/signal transduction histidine kinase